MALPVETRPNVSFQKPATTGGDSLTVRSHIRGERHMGTRASERGRERGAALLEFALVIPLFIYILYSIIAFGAYLALKEDVTHAAADAARATIGVPGCTASTASTTCQTAAAKRADGILGWLSASDVTVTAQQSATSCATTNDPTGWCIQVTVTYDKSIVPSAPGLGVFIPTGATSVATVQVS
jgi:Flp pilus assembly protein TadG